MSSNIDATKPVTGSPTTQSVRDNFLIAKNEISDLQLVRAFRLTSVNESAELFQACNVNNTPQVVLFNQETYIQTSDESSFEFDSVNNEIIYKEAGWYNAEISCHVVRKVAGASLATWTIHTQVKKPSVGSFVNFTAGARQFTFDGTIANYKQFLSFATLVKIEEANSRVRLMQTCDDVTKSVGIIGYAAVPPLPSTAGITWSSSRLGPL